MPDFDGVHVTGTSAGDYTAAQVTNAADKSSLSQQTFTGVLATPNLVESGVSVKTVSYTATASDSTILANGTLTITLPAVAAGQQLNVINIGTGTVTVSPASGTINGAATDTLALQYQSRTYVSDGTNWYRQTANVHRLTHNYAISGAIAVPSAGTNFIPPFTVSVPAGCSATLRNVRHKIRAGTSVTFNVQRNGVTVTNGSALSATTTQATSGAIGQALSDGDELAPVVTAVSGTPDGLYVDFIVDYTF